MSEPRQPYSVMDYAEGLGLTLSCEPCITCVALWDHDKKVWLNEDDEPLTQGKSDPCPKCRTVHGLPTAFDVLVFEKLRAAERR